MWQSVTDKNHWNKLVASQPHARFLQSWQWGDFQMSVGRDVKRLNYNDKLLAQVIKMPLAGGKFYWYIPYGPLVIEAGADVTHVWEALEKELSRESALFVRIDPTSSPPTPSSLHFGGQAKRRGILSTQPQCVRVLDLAKTEEEILAGMHQKTRYNINLAERKGVLVGPGDITEFLKLNHATSQRDEFTSHHDRYYKKMIKALTGDCEAKIWQASFNGQVLASAIVIYFGDTSTYSHGASSNAGRNLMAPYLLHWKIIQDARQQGFKFYDLGGVNPPRDEPVAPRVYLGANQNHPAFKKSWQGITRFKQGFGGEIMCNPRSFDLIYRPWWYRLYRLLKVARKLL